jgi:signal transduction histidine kinase
VKPELRPVGLAEALRPALAAIRRTLPGAVELRIEEPPAPLPVRGDPPLLQQALLNLAVNARDAMPGGGRLVVALEAAERGGKPFARLEVRDTGHGMDAATLARAGEPLFTTKPPGLGTGLGLSNVRTTAVQHGGELEISSTPGAGTRVTLWIPLAPRAEG